MDTININKISNFTNGIIGIKYSGIAVNNNVDLDKIEMLLDNFINNHKHNCMEENVKIVRTILKDLGEKSLVIFCHDEKITEVVKYYNDNLILYEKEKIEEGIEYYNRYKIKYDPTSGIKLEYNNREINIDDYSCVKLVSKEITEIMEKIYYLKNVKSINLNRNDKIIIEIYRLFYNENPDFSSKDINIKVQTMMSILSEFGVVLYDYSGFSLCGKAHMPVSFNLEQLIDKLYPFGEVSNVKDNIKLAKEYKKIIRVAGECIMEAISKQQNQNEALILISKVIHARRYCLPFNSSDKELASFVESTTAGVESSIKLVKSIENKINN